MKFLGKNYIAGQWVDETHPSLLSAWFPRENAYSSYTFQQASINSLNAAVAAASSAFTMYRRTTVEQRAAFLNAIADEVLSIEETLLSVTQEETGYSKARLEGEHKRTVNQLRAFADALYLPEYNARTEEGDPERQPLPKPETTLTWLPLGPVAVFGASNFPYAFSTLGGDTASALAAGCPVIVKAHPSHPGTSELMARAIDAACQRLAMPKGVFSLLHSDEPALSHKLVKHKSIKAVGFTGSKEVGDILRQSINSRVDPIPFYAELGSINPQFIFQRKAEKDGIKLAEQLCQSLMMGNGQFCTSPGIWVVPKDATDFIAYCEHNIQQQSSDVLLSQNILSAYQTAINTIKVNPNVTLLGQAPKTKPYHGAATLFMTTSEYFMTNTQLKKEIFGPSAIVVTYQDDNELHEIVDTLEGQLTASLHGTPEDFKQQANLIERLQFKVGRLIYNQMPTGVEVCETMNHGGPYPASSDVRSTSVGIRAITRFLRPLCIQK